MRVHLLILAAIVLGLTPVRAGAYLVYVSNEKDNTITVVDFEKWRLSGR